jgi:asparagine synthase (glutamine-hydrolysing)
MCGIAGILNLGSGPPIDERVLAGMISLLHHRGPDETGFFVDSRVGLAHARLSIIGLEGGGQPIANEDNSLWIIYNGEAFNYVELRRELVARGHVFRTTTDTEVLLHLYEDLGPACLDRINGQFALAIWDSRKRELFLARDRVGIRPLFYTRVGGRLLFASEIKALFADPAVERAIDPTALADVFTLWSTPAPRTMFRGVRSLRPGHYAIVKDGELTEHAWWTVPPPSDENRYPGSFADAREELHELLKDAVRLRLRADVPVGAYLSGGLDSSFTTALIHRHFDPNVRTFSIGFQEKAFDETSFQEKMAGTLGTPHRRAWIRNSDIAELLPDVVWHAETPLTRSAPAPLLLLSRLVHDDGLKVVLTGEGADEVFGGYNIFREAKVRRFCARAPESTFRARLLERLYPYVAQDAARTRHMLQKFYETRPGDLQDPLFSHAVRWRNSGRNRTFLSPALLESVDGYDPLAAIRAGLPADFLRYDFLAQAQILEMQYFLSSYLLSSQGDRVAMASSVEIRLPFLDYRVIEFAFRLPPHWKVSGLKEKHILKEAARGVVPEEIRVRPKQPYRAPIRTSLLESAARGAGGGVLEELLSPEAVRRTGCFDPSKVERLVARCRTPGSASETQDMALVAILSTQLLHRRFVEDFPRDVAADVPAKAVRVG